MTDFSERLSNGTLSHMRQASVFLLALVAIVPGARAVEVGVASAVNSDAFGTPPGGLRGTKVLGDNVIYNERIETSGSGLVQVLLADGSTFTVGASSDLVIDEFVYDPNGGSGKLVASFGKGVARFVGGKLSKKRGGVTVKTPVGTIGIRGGIANIDLSSNPPVLSFLFGKDLTFTGKDGKTTRIHRSGYSMEIGSNGRTSVRRTTQSDLGNVQTAMTSRNQNGGIPTPPTSSQIEQSGLPRVNSRLGVVTTTPPRKPSPVEASKLSDPETDIIQTQVLQQQQTTEEIEVEEDDGETTVGETDEARVLRAGTGFFVSQSSTSVRDPGTQGIVGGPNGFDEVVVFTQDPDTAANTYRIWSGVADGETIYVFDPDDTVNEYYTQTVTAEGDIAENYSAGFIPDAPVLSGEIVQNARGQRITGEGFGFFLQFQAVEAGLEPEFNYGGTDYFYGLYGDATDFDAFDGSDTEKLRTYELHGDALTAFQLAYLDEADALVPAFSSALFLNPAVAAELGADFLSQVENSGLKILETSSQTLDGASYLTASMYVSDGTSTQKSFVSLSLGEITGSDGSLTLNGERRGGHRTDTGVSAGLYAGTVASLEGASGGGFFGSNADYLVLSPGGLEDGNTFTDGYVEVPSGTTVTDQMSGTMHVAELASEVDVSTLDRVDTTMTGYAAGVLESSVNYASPSIGPVLFNSTSTDGFSIAFDASNGTLYASLTVEDVNETDREINKYEISFGDPSGSGQSVYIDTDTYAAIETTGGAGTLLTTNDGEVVAPTSGTTPDSYIVPSTLVEGADDTLFASTDKCACEFLEWGYWGTKIEADDTKLAQGERFDTFHMGTWVAGEVTDSIDLPSSGDADYTGHAVGNVINNGAQYLASGKFTMSVNFGDRAAFATISDFDGRTMTSIPTEQTVASGNLFVGGLSGPAGLNGTLNASLVAGPNSNHEGVIGNFNAQHGSWSANGIVAGELD
ncbi:MAG: FecR domain-containing protein [Roseibium sp.]|uniref:FecR domain-containing protein n=1 Tax=Roseibium sp. TaxID=1936156 RepID=UPI0026024156|nr:FecR domain-containing protein [Roseibium sp.]MCV0428969.1 FecR domain-containing protein [Roseibium sp.]